MAPVFDEKDLCVCDSVSALDDEGPDAGLDSIDAGPNSIDAELAPLTPDESLPTAE